MHRFPRPMPDLSDQVAVNRYLIERQDFTDDMVRRILILAWAGKSGFGVTFRLFVALSGIVTFLMAVLAFVRSYWPPSP